MRLATVRAGVGRVDVVVCDELGCLARAVARDRVLPVGYEGQELIFDGSDPGPRWALRPTSWWTRAGREPRAVPHGPQAGRTGDRRERPAGPRVRRAARGAEVHRRRDGAAEPQGPQAGAKARCELLVRVPQGIPAATEGQHT